MSDRSMQRLGLMTSQAQLRRDEHSIHAASETAVGRNAYHVNVGYSHCEDASALRRIISVKSRADRSTSVCICMCSWREHKGDY